MFKALAFLGVILVSGPDFGPSDEMFDELKTAPSEEEANDDVAETDKKDQMLDKVDNGSIDLLAHSDADVTDKLSDDVNTNED